MPDQRPGFFRAGAASAASRRVDARVKWFNPSKGFGFVTVEDGADAFLPMAALRRAGYEDVREGAALTCEIGTGERGPLVVAVLNVDAAAAVPAGREGLRSGGRVALPLEGEVKWFEPAKGFGFITPATGGRDVFVHVSVLHRSGVSVLVPGQRVRVEAIEGPKGLEADRITLL